jgi:hypothetical protein
MSSSVDKIERANPKLVFWSIVAIAILLAAQMQFIQKGWINPDSVLYLESAKRISLGDWQGGYNIFFWPFYSACIALIHQLTTFNFHLSAQVLNMLFFGMATASFLKIIEYAGGKNLALVCGAVLLFSNQYIVGDVLEMLMRDEGFWAFHLTSIVFFIRFYRYEKTKDTFLWQVSGSLAVLFRIEAILFLLLLPIIILFTKTSLKIRVAKLIKAYFLSIIILTSIAISITFSDTLTIDSFGRLKEFFSLNLWQELTQKFNTQSTIMSQQVLGSYLKEFAVPGLLLTFLYIIITKAITTSGYVAIVLSSLNIKQRISMMAPDVKHILIVTALIAILNMALIITKVFVLSSRYVVPLGFIVLIFATLYLTALLKQNAQHPKKHLSWIIYIIFLVLFLSLIKNILPKQAGYNYQQHAVTWVQSINTDKKPVFYSDSRLRYYASAPFIGTFSSNWKNFKSEIKDKNILQYDYLIINFSTRDKDIASALNQELSSYKEIKRFYAVKHKKYCAIYHKQI